MDSFLLYWLDCYEEENRESEKIISRFFFTDIDCSACGYRCAEKNVVSAVLWNKLSCERGSRS